MTSQVAFQTLTGYCGLAQYLYRFKLRDSPYCACDPAKTQELHVLEEKLSLKAQSLSLSDFKSSSLIIPLLTYASWSSANRGLLTAVVTDVMMPGSDGPTCCPRHGAYRYVPLRILQNYRLHENGSKYLIES
ncbi:hypothetical protein EVAR_63143_1 [Eumeta japonica]|uniref:Uncharacterized protein n=1 Tax=Eumeta variegata TaxID=151549 RepID=A0A4C2AA12_EUMVA|nr:hypothetical protein EVAR_63143_1 [Eumeta japonica]